MKCHRLIDERGLVLAEAIARRIDSDPQRNGLERAKRVCRQWLDRTPSPAVEEWWSILNQPWERIRVMLLDASQEGCRLRQNSPFCGILSPRERWEILKRFGGKHEQIPA